MIMTDAILTDWNDLNEDVEIGATTSVAIQRGAHGDLGFLGRMAGGIAFMTLRAGINGTRRYDWSRRLMNDLPHQLRRNGGRGGHGLVGRRCNLHHLFPLNDQQSIHPQYFYTGTRPVNKNLRIPCLVRMAQ
jgi:hypothetical protein